jgi:hypothetical protein
MLDPVMVIVYSPDDGLPRYTFSTLFFVSTEPPEIDQPL